MAFDLSSVELPALVEHVQSDLDKVRLRLTEPGPLTPGDRALAYEHVQVVASALGNLNRVLRRTNSAATIQQGSDHVHG
jgi:hypothetical protein